MKANETKTGKYKNEIQNMSEENNSGLNSKIFLLLVILTDSFQCSATIDG